MQTIFKYNKFTFNADNRQIVNGDREFYFHSYDKENKKLVLYNNKNQTGSTHTFQVSAFISNPDVGNNFWDWIKNKFPEWEV